MAFLSRWIIHPFLFSLFPVLFFMAYNRREMIYDEDTLWIIAGIEVVAFLLVILFSRLFNNMAKGGLMTSCLLFLVLSWGHVYAQLSPWYWKNLWMIPVHSQTMFLGVLAMLVATVAFMLWRAQSVALPTTFFNVVGIYMILMAMGSIGQTVMDGTFKFTPTKVLFSATHAPHYQAPQKPTPDIYYIILDGYPGNSVLKTHYHYDNAPFIHSLKQAGFYTAEQSTSNYVATFLSLASSLNYRYLPNIKNLSEGRPLFDAMINDSHLVRVLKHHGYHIVNFASGYGATQYLKQADTNINCSRLNEFYTELVRTTLLGLFDKDVLVDKAAEQKQCTFQRLDTVASIPGPKFVFAHIVSPHPPYLFDQKGHVVSMTTYSGGNNPVWQDKPAFLGQLLFVNQTILGIVHHIIKDNATPPIIIIQGDHGTASSFRNARDWFNPTDAMVNERTHILNAYYIPKPYHVPLYPTITPVNSFRSILTSLHFADLPLLPDINYFSSYNTHTKDNFFNNVTDRVEH